MNDSAVETPIPPALIPAPPIANRAPTLVDVAKIAGVSHVAASVVLNLNSRSKVRVSPATRARILAAARALNYQPNALARSLRQRKTNVIGFYAGQGNIFDPLFPFHGNLLKGLMEGCKENRKSFLMHGLFANDDEDAIFQELLNGQLDGLVVYAREITPLIRRLIDSHLPVVFIANEVPGVPCVSIDNVQGGQILARYLGERSYRKAFYLVTNEVLPHTLATRFQSFQAEAAKLGMEVEKFYTPSISADSLRVLRERIAPEAETPVIACYSDFTADELFALCQEQGIHVPREMAIAGFDGFLPVARPARKLTTVQVPWVEVARRAIEILVAQCNGESVPMLTKLPVELIVGDTA